METWVRKPMAQRCSLLDDTWASVDVFGIVFSGLLEEKTLLKTPQTLQCNLHCAKNMHLNLPRLSLSECHQIDIQLTIGSPRQHRVIDCIWDSELDPKSSRNDRKPRIRVERAASSLQQLAASKQRPTATRVVSWSARCVASANSACANSNSSSRFANRRNQFCV